MFTYRNDDAYETLTDALSVAKPHHYIVAVTITSYLVVTDPSSLRSVKGGQDVRFVTLHRPLFTELILPSDKKNPSAANEHHLKNRPTGTAAER